MSNFLLNQYVIALSTTGVINAGLGIFVILKGFDKKLNRLLALYSLSLFLWSVFEAFGITRHNESLALLLWRLNHVGVIFIPIFLTHFVFLLLEVKGKKKRLIPISYVVGFIFLILDATPLLILEVVPKFPFNYFINPGYFYYVFFGLWIGWAIYGNVELFREYFRTSGYRRNQMKYFCWPLLFSYFGGVPNFLPTFNIEIPIVMPYATYAIPLYAGFATYAIVRHRLMDIDVIIKKTLIFAGVFAVAFGVFAGFAYVGSIWFENVVNNRWIALLPSVFVIVLILRPLENFLRSVTDKFLFQKKYDYKHLLKTFSEDVLTVIEFNDLVHLTVNKLAEILKLDNTLLFLYDEDGEQYQLAASVLPENSDKISIVLKENGTLSGYMRKRKKYFMLNGVRKGKKPPPNIMQELQKLETALVIPLTHHGEMVGILSLGKKKSDEEFTQDDIDVLLPLAKTLSIAITNATLFQELSKAQARAAQREKMAVIGTLSAGINHEICNPLGIARGQCEMFLLNIAEGVYKGKTQKELLAKAQEIMMKVIHETDRATLITRKLSSFAKPATGEILDDISLGKEVKVVISLLEHDLKLDNITINKEIPEDLPNISADRKQLQEIFFNIIRNAVQSIKDAGEIFIRLSSSGKKVYVEIEDTGVGISKSELEQIFDPFYTTKDPGKGTGLGLYIVKQIIEKNKGKISVRSELGKGTTFLLIFDAIESDKR